MKKIIIKQFTFAEVDAPDEAFGFLKIPNRHTVIRAEGQDLEVSDSYHTMDELYEHRIELYIALCRHMHEVLGIENPGKFKVWRSKYHSDGELCFGTGMQFILGIRKEKGKQITYHIPIEQWDETNFAETLDRAPEWDGHTSADVLTRLKML